MDSDSVTAPPLIEWQDIMVATVGPAPPSQGDPEVCQIMYQAWENNNNLPIWDDCSDMSSNWATLILGHFHDGEDFNEDFRHDDLECQQLYTTLQHFLGSASTRSRGGGSYSGLAAIDDFDAYGVWFNEGFFSYSLSEQRLTAAHEAYHLATLDHIEENAELAARYCWRMTEDHPFGPT